MGHLARYASSRHSSKRVRNKWRWVVRDWRKNTTEIRRRRRKKGKHFAQCAMAICACVGAEKMYVRECNSFSSSWSVASVFEKG